MQSAREALEAMGMSVDEVLMVDDVLRTRPAVRDGRICLCGHSMTKHLVIDGIVSCKPSKMDCPCKNCRPVIDTEDTRPFLRRTQGAGPEHALSRGLAALAMRNKNAQWIIDLECDMCKQHSSQLIPVPVTQSGIAVDYATGYDALLCPSCRGLE